MTTIVTENGLYDRNNKKLTTLTSIKAIYLLLKKNLVIRFVLLSLKFLNH